MYDDPDSIRSRAEALAGTVRDFHARGWCLATSGNFSIRLGPERALISASGKDKGRFGFDDTLVVDLDGRSLAPGAGHPSAEVLLHCDLYRRFPKVGSVLHVHTTSATVLSHLETKELDIDGYEMLKAFAAVETHETFVRIPIVENDQDMSVLAEKVAPLLDARVPGYLIRGHGLYAWGEDLEAARRHVEAFEFLFGCELEKRRLVR